jgi:hypothetical protein
VANDRQLTQSQETVNLGLLGRAEIPTILDLDSPRRFDASVDATERSKAALDREARTVMYRHHFDDDGGIPHYRFLALGRCDVPQLRSLLSTLWPHC